MLCVGVEDASGDAMITLEVSALLDVCRFLRDEPDLKYDLLLFVTAVDRLDMGIEPALRHRLPLSIPSRIAIGSCSGRHLRGNSSTCPSVTSIWPAANWHERETYDLMGIEFEGHPAFVPHHAPLTSGKGIHCGRITRWAAEPVAFTETVDDPKLAGLGSPTCEAPSKPPLLPPDWVTHPDTMIVNMGPPAPGHPWRLAPGHGAGWRTHRAVLAGPGPSPLRHREDAGIQDLLAGHPLHGSHGLRLGDEHTTWD